MRSGFPLCVDRWKYPHGMFFGFHLLPPHNRLSVCSCDSLWNFVNKIWLVLSLRGWYFDEFRLNRKRNDNDMCHECNFSPSQNAILMDFFLFFYNVIDRVLTNPPLSLSLSHTRWLAPCANEFTIKIVWLSHGTTNNNTRGLPANKGHVSHRQIDRRAHHHHQP